MRAETTINTVNWCDGIDTLDRSLFKKWRRGEITILEAARRFCAHGWTNYTDEGYTRRVFYRLMTEDAK